MPLSYLPSLRVVLRKRIFLSWRVLELGRPKSAPAGHRDWDGHAFLAGTVKAFAESTCHPAETPQGSGARV